MSSALTLRLSSWNMLQATLLQRTLQDNLHLAGMQHVKPKELSALKDDRTPTEKAELVYGTHNLKYYGYPKIHLDLTFDSYEAQETINLICSIASQCFLAIEVRCALEALIEEHLLIHKRLSEPSGFVVEEFLPPC